MFIDRRNALKAFVGSLVFVLLVSCGTWIGNPKDQDSEEGDGGKSNVQLVIRGQDTLNLIGSAINVKGADGGIGGTIVLDKALVSLSDIRFKMLSDIDQTRIDLKGPYVADLLSDTTTPSLADFSIPSGVYKEIELKMTKLDVEDSAGADQSIVNNSVYLVGTYTSNLDVSKNFELSFDLSEEFKISNDTGVTLDANTLSTINMIFDLTTWFDFSDLTINSESLDFGDVAAGSITLSKDSGEVESKLMEVIKDRIKQSADFLKE